MATKVCAFTGHRPNKLPFRYNEADKRCILLKKRLREECEKLITERGVSHFITGMALGVDTYAAEIVLELKREYPDITLEAAIPCPNQALRWNERDILRYEALLSACDKKTVVSPSYNPGCMQKRNKYMVDSADVLIAVWNGEEGGTANTVAYASSHGVETVVIDLDC